MDTVRILYIEDDRVQRRSLTEALEAKGFTVTAAADGPTGIDLFVPGSFDVVLCDLNMEPVDGLEVLRRIRAVPSDVPFMILTAHGSAAQAAEAIKQGAYHFLLKPPQIDDIELTIYQALEHATLQRRLGDRSRDLEQQVAERTGRLKLANEQLAALNEVSNRLIQIKDEAALIEQVPRLLTSTLDFDRALLLLSRGDRLTFGSVCFAKDPAEMERRLIEGIRDETIPLPDAIRESVETGETVFIRDLNTDPRWPKEPDEVIRTKAMVITPVRTPAGPIGALTGNMQHHQRDMDEQDVARFEMFANMVGLAFENTRAYQSLEQAVQQRTAQLSEKARQLENSALELGRANVDLLTTQEELEEKNIQLNRILDELSLSKDRLQVILDSATDVVILVDPEGAVVSSNAQMRAFFNLDAKTVEGMSFAEFVERVAPCFASPEKFITFIRDHESSDDDPVRFGRPSEILQRALQVVRPEARYVAPYTLPVIRDQQEFGRVWMFADVTKLKKANEQVMALVEAAPIPMIISRVDDGRIVFVNDHLGLMMGVRKSDLIGRQTIDFYYDPAERARVMEILQREGMLRDKEFRLRLPDGRVVWTIFSLVVTEIDGERVIVGGLYDITERKEAEEALRRERNFVQAILDTAGALIVVLDPEGRIVSFNRTCEVTTGYTFDEVRMRPFWDLFLVDEERERTVALFHSIVSGNFPVEGENCWVTKSGERRLISWSNTAITGSDGAVEHVIATGIDITEARRTEEKLRLYQRIFETSADGITIFDRDHRLIARNPAHEVNSGYPDDEILGRPADEIIDREKLEDVQEAVQRDGGFRGEVDIRRRDGSSLPVDLSVFRIDDEQGELLYTVGMGRDITARKEAEIALRRAHDELERRVEQRTGELRESEAKNRALVSVIPDLIFRLNRDGTYLDYRAPKGSPLAVPPEQIVGANVREMLPPELAEQTLRTLARALESQEIQTLEYSLPHAGEEHYFEARVVVSGPNEALAIVRDISDRKRAEEALRRAHDELEMRVEQRTAQLARVNEALRGEVRERKQAQDSLADRLRYEEALAACSRILLPIGDSRDALARVLSYLREAAGVSRAYIFENFEDPDDGLCMRQTYEVCADDIEPQIDNQLLQHAPYKDGFDRWREMLSAGEPVAGRVRGFPDSERAVLEPQGILSIVVLPIMVNQRWFGFIGFDDCTEGRESPREDIRTLRTAAEMIGVYLTRKQAQDALRYSEERFRSLVENAHDIIFSMTPEGEFTYISPQFTELTGYPVGDYLGKTMYPLMHPDNVDEARTWFASGLPEGTMSTGYEFRAQSRDGSWRWFILNGSVLRDQTGRAEEVVGVMHDITPIRQALDDLERANRDLRDAQAQLVQSEKMASLGMLVAGIAHEINTPVGAISSMHNTLVRAIARLRETIETTYPLASEHDRKLQSVFKAIEDANRVIDSGASRVTTIVRRLRSFARLDEAELKRVDLHEGLEDTLTLIHHEIKHNIEIVRDYGDLPEIACYPGRLNQVFLNLFNNARQAISSSGIITVGTRAEGSHVYVTITDNGAGIPQEQLRHIFDPGFTTKGVGVGTGLGLSICYQIIQEHRGSIEVASEVGKGTTFTIRLPVNLDKGSADR